MSSEENVELKIEDPMTVSQTISEKEFKRKTYWKTCCGSRLDKRAVQFFSQLTISLIVIIFSLYQLYREKNTEIYLSLLTMIIGLYTEAPRLN
jgi:hypothetical protein